MKISELSKIIEEIASKEIKKAILQENKGMEVYHIKCEGVPLATFKSEEEAQKALDHFKHKGDLIIEKGVYEDHGHMLDKMDEMNDQFDEELKGNQEKIDANHNGKIDADDFKKLRADDEECNECGDQSMEEVSLGDYTEPEDNPHHEGHDTNEPYHDYDGEGTTPIMEEKKCECGGTINEAGICNECGNLYEHPADGDDQYHRLDEAKVCDECGGSLNEHGMCNECGWMHESEAPKKKSVTLKESDLVELIKKMVSESIPGLETYKKAHKDSGAENKKEIDVMMKDVEKNHINVEGNDKPEFPHQVGKGEAKMARKNSSKQDEVVKRNLGGLQDLAYELEPSEKFKERAKMAIEGDKLMGNAPTTEKTNIVASNGAKAEEAEDKQGNTTETPETAEVIEKQAKDYSEDRKNRVLYAKEKVPVKKMNESSLGFTSILNEEVEKMKKLSSYNKKTQ